MRSENVRYSSQTIHILGFNTIYNDLIVVERWDEIIPDVATQKSNNCGLRITMTQQKEQINRLMEFYFFMLR